MTQPEYAFYRRTYDICDRWLRKHGFARGLTPIESVFNQPDLDRPKVNLNTCETSPGDDDDEEVVVEVEPKVDDDLEESIENVEVDSEITSNDEIDPDYLRAIRLTRKHQKEQATRREKESLDWFDYVDYSQRETYFEKSHVPPPEKKSKKGFHHRYQRRKVIQVDPEVDSRTQKRLELYGARDFEVEEIIARETDLQHRFDRFCDQHQPRFWPLLPVRFDWTSNQ